MVVGVMCPHPLDAVGHALHHLDFRLWGLPLCIMPFPLPSASKRCPPLPLRPASPPPPSLAGPFPAPGPPPRYDPSCRLPCACPLPPPLPPAPLPLSLSCRCRPPSPPAPLSFPCPRLCLRPYLSPPVRIPPRALDPCPCTPLLRAVARHTALLAKSGLHHPWLQLRHCHSGPRSALWLPAAGARGIPQPPLCERSSGCQGPLWQVEHQGGSRGCYWP